MKATASGAQGRVVRVIVPICLALVLALSIAPALAIDISITSMREFDQSIESIRAKGVTEWFKDSVQKVARENFPSVFGERGETVDRVVTAGEHTYSIGSRAFDAINRMQSAASASEAERHSEDFWAWVRGEELPEMVRDVMPESVKSVIDRAREIQANATWAADKVTTGARAVSSLSDRVRPYFSEVNAYGLEPAGLDTRVIAVARSREPDGIQPEQSRIESAIRLLDADSNTTERVASGAARNVGDLSAIARDLGVKPSPEVGVRDWVAESQAAEQSVKTWELEQARRAEVARRAEEAKRAAEAKQLAETQRLQREQREAAERAARAAQLSTPSGDARHAATGRSEPEARSGASRSSSSSVATDTRRSGASGNGFVVLIGTWLPYMEKESFAWNSVGRDITEARRLALARAASSYGSFGPFSIETSVECEGSGWWAVSQGTSGPGGRSFGHRDVTGASCGYARREDAIARAWREFKNKGGLLLETHNILQWGYVSGSDSPNTHPQGCHSQYGYSPVVENQTASYCSGGVLNWSEFAR